LLFAFILPKNTAQFNQIVKNSGQDQGKITQKSGKLAFPMKKGREPMAGSFPVLAAKSALYQ